MSLRFIDSFDHYVSADGSEKWTSVGSTFTISAGNGRRGTSSARGTGTANTAGPRKTLDAEATWIVGCAFRTTFFPTLARPIFHLLDTSTIQVDVVCNNDGTLSVRRGASTVLGTTTFALSTNVYHFIEFKCTISDASGIAVLRVDGDTKLNLSSVDTKQTSNATVNSIEITPNSNWGSTVDIDDVYICDNQGSTNNDFLGDCRVDCLLPNADGSNSQFTPSTGSDHYALVDDASPDDDTTYLSHSTSGQKDTWNFANLTALTSPSIKGVQLNLTAKKDDAGSRLLKPVVKSGSTTSSGSSQGLSTDYLQFAQIYETDPDTSAAWTESGVNSAEFGAEVA
jgi:hypothetical protein